jgi:hypothetical protein
VINEQDFVTVASLVHRKKTFVGYFSVTLGAEEVTFKKAEEGFRTAIIMMMIRSFWFKDNLVEELISFENSVDMLDCLLHLDETSNSDRGLGLFTYWNDAFKDYKALRPLRPCVEETPEEEWVESPEYVKLQKLTVTFKKCTEEIQSYQVRAKSELKQAEKVLSRLMLYSSNRLSLSTYDCGAVDKFLISLNKAWTNYESAFNKSSELREELAKYSEELGLFTYKLITSEEIRDHEIASEEICDNDESDSDSESEYDYKSDELRCKKCDSYHDSYHDEHMDWYLTPFQSSDHDKYADNFLSLQGQKNKLLETLTTPVKPEVVLCPVKTSVLT